MYRRVTDPRRIGHELADLMRNHRQIDADLERYVASVVSEGVRFDWYTIGRELRKSGPRGNGKSEPGLRYKKQFDELAVYLKKRLSALGVKP
jgi:hypothetical protein